MRTRTLTFVLVLVLALPAFPLLARPAWERAAQPLLDRLTAAPAPVLPFELAPPGAPDGVVATLSGTGDAARLWVRDDGGLVLQAGPGTVRIRPVAGSGTVVAGPPSPTVVRRYTGPPDQWRDPVPTAQWLELRQLWPGVDLRLVPRPGGFEKLLTLAPGRGAEGVAFEVAGATPQLDADGTLALTTEEGTVFRVAPPQAFQPRADGGRDPLPAAYWVAGQRYGVQLLAPPDPTRPLVIDPLVSATFLGGSGLDTVGDVRRLSRLPDGRLVVAVYTQSPTFPGAGGPRPGGPGDAVLVALDPALTTVSWATYLGGSGDDIVWTVDATSGDVFVVGSTTSFTDFPGTLIGPGGGSQDAFIARLAADGALQWARRIGGAANVYLEEFAGVRVASGAVYAVGSTDSDWQAASIPNGAYDTSFDRSGTTPPLGAAVVARFDLDGNLTAWTYDSVPGNNSYAFDLVVWDSGLAVVGNACGIHTTSGAFQPNCQGGGDFGDGWLAVFSLDLQTLQYGTYLGSPGSDVALTVVRDPARSLLWVSGYTDGAAFPTTADRLQGCGNGGYDAFLVAIAPVGAGASDLRYGTCLGSSGDDRGIALTLDFPVLGLAATVSGPVGPGWTPAGSAFFDETYNGASGTVNDYLALLELGGTATAPTVTLRAWSYLGSDRNGNPSASGLVLWDESVCEGDTCVDRYFLARSNRQDGQLLDGLPRNLPVGPAVILQPEPAGDQDAYLAVWEAGSRIEYPSSVWQVPAARASSAQLTVVGQGSVVSSVWDWDGTTALRFAQAGPGTQSITTASQRPFLNQLVWLAATPSPGWTFQGWSGDCTGTTPTVQVTVDQDFACTATFVPSGGGADLVVASLQATPQGGSTYAVMARVANQGTAASPATRIRFVLNATGAPAGRYAAEVPVAALNAGQSLTVTVRVTLQGSERFVVAIVDPLDQVPETNEANNHRFLRLR
ncbi:hypothetical protein OO015_04890 [Thermomicrobium sp. 4228-Ro]|uniref:DUF7948 domain-containing protein n=1 Tax=Thermomicrobium sp. 4228-Ro TaxID=2993937 RepID=UPI002248AD39|nr:CARDB domain-containing protein [Thermomicrobium sp. 4228-Ro]MCX2726830.1 hypothetical protein [Thermomicrobium sp. 4228-Ro]